MKTFKDFIPSLFADYSDDLATVTGMTSKLQSVSSSSSSFLNALAIGKMVSNQTSMSKFECNILNSLSNLADFDFTKGGITVEQRPRRLYYHEPNVLDELDEVSLACKSLIDFIDSKIGHYELSDITDSTVFDTIGYFNGMPIQAALVRLSPVAQPALIDYNYVLAFCFGQQEFYSGQMVLNPFLDIRLSAVNSVIDDVPGLKYNVNLIIDQDLERDDPWIYDADAKVNGVKELDYVTATLEQIISEAANYYVSNECMLNIIKRAQTDGNISRDQIQSIINLYQKTDFIETLQTLIAGTKSLSDISIITLIGKIYQNMGASYSAGSDTMNIYSEPTYITSIITAVIAVLVSTVVTILAIVWRVIGVIVSMLASIIGTVINLIKDNINRTNADIISQTLVPIINNPLLTFQLTSGQMELWLSACSRSDALISLDEMDEVLQEYGCAMVGPNYGGQCPYYYWILPRDYSDNSSKYTVQLLITLARYTGSIANNLGLMSLAWEQTEINTASAGTNRSGSFIFEWYSDSGTWNPDNRMFNGYDDQEYHYLTMTDDQIRTTVYYNTIKALSDVSSYNENFLGAKFGSSTAGIGMITTAFYLGPTSENPSLTLMTIDNCLSNLKVSDQYNLLTGWTPMKRLAYLAHFLTISRGSVTTSSYSWDELTKLYKYIHDIDISNDPTLYCLHNTSAKLSYFNFGDGNTLATPAIEWPDLSRGALLNALVVTGITAAAIAGIAVGTKIGLKKFAFNKLSSRQLKFDEAKEKYQKMNEAIQKNKKTMGGYTQAQIDSITNEYYKSNKRLTRAWALAGKLGLSMYNGFSTNSTSTVINSLPSDSLSNITSTVLNNAIPNQFALNSTNDAIYENGLDKIYASITGDVV